MIQKTTTGFGGVTFGLPEITVDWEGIEKSQSEFEKTIEAQKNNSSRTGSGFTSYDPEKGKLNRLTMAGSGIGFASGVAYAFYNKTGFWKGWGIAIVGAITIASLTRGVGFLTGVDNEKKIKLIIK